MIGKIFGFLVIISCITAVFTGNIQAVSASILDGATKGVEISLSLMGVICFWNGAIKVLDKIGATKIISFAISPVLKIMFPDACKENKGKEEIASAISANFLGLGNAALPFGIRAMEKLKNAPYDTVATNEMVMLCVLNTAPFQLIPSTLIALRSAAGSNDAFEIIFPIWICSILTVCFAVIVCKALSGVFR